MQFEKGEELKDINELLDILKEKKAYYCVNVCETKDSSSYYLFLPEEIENGNYFG